MIPRPGVAAGAHGGDKEGDRLGDETLHVSELLRCRIPHQAPNDFKFRFGWLSLHGTSLFSTFKTGPDPISCFQYQAMAGLMAALCPVNTGIKNLM